MASNRRFVNSSSHPQFSQRSWNLKWRVRTSGTNGAPSSGGRQFRSRMTFHWTWWMRKPDNDLSIHLITITDRLTLCKQVLLFKIGWGREKPRVFKMGQPQLLFLSFLSFHTENYINSKQDSNSDSRSRRRRHWPLDHHQGPEKPKLGYNNFKINQPS